MMRITREQLKRYTPEILIACFVSVSTGLMAWYIHKIGLMLAITDQSAHLNFARLALDSFTPGLSQIGFWPPLLHILMIPAASIKFLYESGFAGFITLFPILIAGSIFLYKLTLLLTKKKSLAFLSVSLLLTNPYILYYSVTPMMEVLFISNLLIVAYFFALWLENEKVTYLILSGIFVSLTCLSRFEGFILLPVVFVLILIQLLKQKKLWAEIEANQIVFGFLASLGLVFALLYSFVYSGNPLTFAGGGWWLRSPIEGLDLIRGNLVLTGTYILHALYYMIGKPLVLVSLLLALPLFVSFRKQIKVFAPLCILVSPTFFLGYSLFRGSVPMNLPGLDPVNGFLNERYVLSWVSFLALALPLFINLISERLPLNRMKYPQMTVVVCFIFSIYFSIFHFYSVVFVNDFETIRKNTGIPSEGQLQLADFLKKNYDYGKILAVRVDNDPVFVKAGLPLVNYIHEGNFKLYDQAFNEPWIFSRWVIMYNADDKTDKWARLKEPVSVRWRNDAWFHKYYDLVYKNEKKELYKINSDRVMELAERQRYNMNKIPSINQNIVSWDEKTIFSEIGVIK